MHVGLEHYLTVSALLFSLGLLGVIVRRNVLIMYMSLELMLNAANLAFAGFCAMDAGGRADRTVCGYDREPWISALFLQELRFAGA